MLDLVDCSGLRRLTLLGNCQCGVGLRRMTALAAPSPWDGLACSGLRRVAQFCSATLVWYIVEKTAQATTWLASMVVAAIV
jgi:hypothetical protein